MYSATLVQLYVPYFLSIPPSHLFLLLLILLLLVLLFLLHYCYYYCCCFSLFYPSIPRTDDVSLSLLLLFSLATGDVNSVLDCLQILLGECVGIFA